MISRKTMMASLWPESAQPSIDGLGGGAGFRPPSTPAERRAEETTRVAREMTDAAAERRHSRTAQLRQARMEKDAADKAAAPVPKKRKG